MASNEDARAAREAKLDELHEKLTGAVESLVSGDDWRQALAFAARFRSRSFNNTMLIWVQHEVAFEAGRVPDPRPCSGYQIVNGLLTQTSPCACCSCWVSQYSRAPEVGDVGFYGGKVSRYKIAYIPASRDLFLKKYYIQVQQSSISKEVYDYWKLVKVQKEGGTSLFQPTSAKIKGNLQCVNDPTAEIFGLFSVSATKTKSIFIQRSDIPYDLLPNEEFTEDCRSLTKNSSIIKPGFW